MVIVSSTHDEALIGATADQVHLAGGRIGQTPS
jgi:hypothetical protein